MKSLAEAFKNVFHHPDNFGMLLGYEVQEISAGHARTAITIEEKHISPSGLTHGGVISAFVDFSMGAALFKALPKGALCSTIEFKINYISPVKLGETIVGDAKIKSKGKSHAVIECHVFRPKEEDRKDVAVALGTYNIYPNKKGG
ncbi:MAG: PaaI family thioesterase [bacterium]